MTRFGCPAASVLRFRPGDVNVPQYRPCSDTQWMGDKDCLIANVGGRGVEEGKGGRTVGSRRWGPGPSSEEL